MDLNAIAWAGFGIGLCALALAWAHIRVVNDLNKNQRTLVEKQKEYIRLLEMRVVTLEELTDVARERSGLVARRKQALDGDTPGRSTFSDGDTTGQNTFSWDK